MFIGVREKTKLVLGIIKAYNNCFCLLIIFLMLKKKEIQLLSKKKIIFVGAAPKMLTSVSRNLAPYIYIYVPAYDY